MKSMRIALAATAVSVMVVGASATLQQTPLPEPSPGAATIKPGTQLPVIVPRLLVASPARLSIVADSGVRRTVTFTASYTGAGGVLDVQSDKPTHVSDPVVTPLGDGRFSITLQTSDLLAEGAYRGSLRLRMCTDAGCANPIAGATAAVPYQLRMRWVNPGEWETFQRDAGHRGYVPVIINAAKIHKAWEWQNPTQTFIHPVATSVGRVYVTETQAGASSGVSRLYSLREVDGGLHWQKQFAVSYARLNPPATSGDNVYVASTGHEYTFLFGFQQSDAVPLFQSSFATQWSGLLAPTVADGVIYTAGGYYGGGIYAYNAEDGTPFWSRFNGDEDMTTPAVEDGLVYHFNNTNGLNVYDSSTGETVASIADPVPQENYGYSYDAAPTLGEADHVFAMSGFPANGLGRFIVDYSPSASAPRWTSARRYVGTAAFKEGVLYAASNNPKAFDAIDALTGQRLWSWIPEPTDTRFQGNVVLTRNLAFVSTDKALYAIDLVTRQPVWSIPVPGTVAISGEGTLYLIPAQAPNQPPSSKLLAYRLR